MNRISRLPRVPHVIALALAVAITSVSTTATAGLFGRADVQRPAEAEFGLGPRASLNHTYTATLQPAQTLRVRQLQSVPVLIVDTNGRPIDGAVISVDGGMPEHGHGLPTRPRVTRALGGGVYEIEGLRFNMGGWWELKLAIEAADGADSVTFNLSL